MHCRAISLSTCGVKSNYMTYLLGFNIVACTWRSFLHVKVNIMLADHKLAYRSMFSSQIVI